MEIVNLLLIVCVAFLLVLGPPLLWYSRGRKLGERRSKRWGIILFGILFSPRLVASSLQRKMMVVGLLGLLSWRSQFGP